MATSLSSPSILCNQLVASSQLETSSSQLDGVPPALENAIRFHSAHLLQAAGILLRLPQDIIAQAIVLLFRYWTGPDGGSMLDADAKVSSLTSCTCSLQFIDVAAQIHIIIYHLSRGPKVLTSHAFSYALSRHVGSRCRRSISLCQAHRPRNQPTTSPNRIRIPLPSPFDAKRSHSLLHASLQSLR
jgi:hypothetical protein